MAETLFLNGSLWVHLASMLYMIGFWVRDQLLLRLLVLFGTVFYILNYYYSPDVPMWSAIVWSMLLGAVNLYVTFQLALERTTFRMSRDDRQLYGAFGNMTPGEFRKLAEKATWRQPRETEVLTREGMPNRRLFYIVEGEVTLSKKGRSFTMPAGTFVGEVSYLLKSAASATVRADRHVRYIEWRHQDLMAIESRYQGIRIALRDILNADLAAKVAGGNGGNCSCETVEPASSAGGMPLSYGAAAACRPER